MKANAIIGVGNSFRGDDAVGVLVAQELLKNECCHADVFVSDGNVTNLLDIFSRYSDVIIVDAVAIANREPGLIMKLGAGDLTDVGLQSSSHSVGIAEAVQLAETLESMPKSLVIYGIVGKNFKVGESMDYRVRDSIFMATNEILAELRNTK